MPPVFTGAARLPLRLLRVIDIPPEVLSLLRYGRGVDTNAFVDTGFEYLYTTPATVDAFRGRAGWSGSSARLPSTGPERDVEDFLRNSPRWCSPKAEPPAYVKNLASKSWRRSSHSSRVIA